MVLLAIREDKTILEIASEYGVDPKSVRDWKKEFLENASLIFDRKKDSKPYQEQVKKLEDTRNRSVNSRVKLVKKKVKEFGI